MKLWYVYVYLDSDGVARYVGIGSTPNRWVSHLKKSDNIWLRRMVSDHKKFGKPITYFKVLENVSKISAVDEERRLIALHGREGIDADGTLYNRTSGGDGTCDFSRPQSDAEIKKKSASIQAYWDSPAGQARKAWQSELAKKQRLENPQIEESLRAAAKRRAGKPSGRKQTEEWKKMVGPIVAESNRRRPMTEERRQKLKLAGSKGGKASAEARKRRVG